MTLTDLEHHHACFHQQEAYSWHKIAMAHHNVTGFVPPPWTVIMVQQRAAMHYAKARWFMWLIENNPNPCTHGECGSNPEK